MRLGGYKSDHQVDDSEEIKKHPFFNGIKWDKIYKKTHKAPFKPRVNGKEDTSCIDNIFTDESLKETLVDPSAMMQNLDKDQRDQIHFQNFTYDEKGNII